MKTRQLLASLVAVNLLLAGCGNKGLITAPVATTGVVAGATNKTAPRYTNRLVVKFKSGANDSAVRAFTQRFSLSAVRPVSALGVGVMGLPANKDAATMLKAIQGHPDVDYVEPDYVYSVPSSPKAKAKAKAATAARRVAAATSFLFNDTMIARQWAIPKIGLPQTWTVDTGAPGIKVAVIDTGVDTRHPDLVANLVKGYSVFSKASGPEDDNGHGTHVAGIIAALGHNNLGIAGVAPGCKIMPVKVLNAEGKGDTGDIVEGLLWAVDNGAKVINMSLGGTGGSRALMDAIAYAQSRDVVVVAAMGNDGVNAQEYPAGYPGVIGVGASDSADEIAYFSNFGNWISVAAPGVDILSTMPTHKVYMNEAEGHDTSYDVMDGTSMASPYVAGLAALVRSKFPAMTAPQVKLRIERSADDLGDPGFDDYFGHGRINARRAVLGD